MNKLTTILLILLSFTLFTLSSCEEEGDVKITLDTVEDGMKLTVNEPEMVLSQDKMEETALRFTWGPAQTRKNNGEITYAFKLGLPGFTTATDTIVIDKDVFEYSFSHYDLNMLIYSKLGMSYGSTVQLEAEIIAYSNGDYFVKPEISTVKFLVTTFKVAPVNLYLVGSANPAGEEIGKGIKLTEVIEGRDIGNKYKWEGELQAGTFKFVNSTSEDKGSWSKGATESDLVSNGTDAEFTVNKPGLYSIILNKATGEIIHGHKGFSHVWGVGSGIGIAWSMPSSTEFTWDARTPNLFTLECNTQAGQDFKLPYNDQSAGWGCPFLRPVVGNASIWADNRVHASPGGFNPDNKWMITADEAGHCLLTIDALNETITLEKLP